MKLGKMFAIFFVFMAVITVVSAVNLEITSVDINNKDRVVANGHTLNYKYERGEKLSIDVCVQALTM